MSARTLDFFRDSSGAPRARGTDRQLAAYLETDCQSATGVVVEILGALATGTDHEFVGNAHSLTLSGQRASIEPLHDEVASVRHLSRSYLESTLREWLKYVAE